MFVLLLLLVLLFAIVWAVYCFRCGELIVLCIWLLFVGNGCLGLIGYFMVFLFDLEFVWVCASGGLLVVAWVCCRFSLVFVWLIGCGTVIGVVVWFL